MKISNPGWAIAAIGWLISSIIIPFLPELTSGGKIFGYPAMEYIGTIGLFAAMFLIVWIPAGMKIAKAYSQKGWKSSLTITLVTFAALVLVWLVIFKFLWNS